MKQTLRRDWESCELEMSAVHHSILQPTFSLQEQHHCPRIAYTDASLHLHSAVLLLLEQKLLLDVGKTRQLDHLTNSLYRSIYNAGKKSLPLPPKFEPSIFVNEDPHHSLTQTGPSSSSHTT